MCVCERLMVCTPGGIFPLKGRIKNLLLVNIILTCCSARRRAEFPSSFFYCLLPVRQFAFSHKTMKIKRKTYRSSTCEGVLHHCICNVIVCVCVCILTQSNIAQNVFLQQATTISAQNFTFVHTRTHYTSRMKTVKTET